MSLFVFLLRHREKSIGRAFGLLNGRIIDLLYACGLALLLFLLLMVFNLFVALLPSSLRDTLTSGFHWQPEKNTPVYLLFIFSLAIGLREEFFFRSYLLTRFSALGLPPWPAMLISTTLFSVGHIYQGILALIFAFTQGLLFSVFFLKKKKLPVLALAHGLYNFVTLLLAIYGI